MVKNIVSVIFFIYFCYLENTVAITKDYCAEQLCKTLGKHIACDNDGKISPDCAPNSEILNLSSLKDIIVDVHNSYRDQIASGQVSGYAPAVRMATMTWDDELAYLAELNVKSCKFEHDDCHNTDDFNYSGQNLAYWSGYPAVEPKEAILSSIQNWYTEYKNANMNIINKFRMPRGSHNGHYGHFTVMVADTNFKVGCACLKTFKDMISPNSGKNRTATTYLFSCNYAVSNIINYPIYKSGKPASNCTTGKNPYYKSLCSVNEIYDPNSFGN